VVTPGYAHEGVATVPISMQALKLLRHIQRSPYGQVKALQLSASIHTEVERILLGYITYLLERRLQSVEFIRRVREI